MGYNIQQYSTQTSYNLSRTSRGTSGIKYIVVHYTGTNASARNNIIYFSGGNRSASADFFIDDNSIWQFNPNPLNYYSWHCGDGRGAYGITNSNSVGIEVVSAGEDFSSAEIDRLTWLVQKLMNDYNVSSSNVVRHYDASRKQCPYPYVNSSKWANLKAQITGGSYSGNASSNDDGNLSRGSYGSNVKDLQEKLIRAGYSCGSAGADGDFGPATDSAVRRFQSDHGLVVDGIVGPITIAKLNEVLNSNSQQSAPTQSTTPAQSTASSGNLAVDGDCGKLTITELQRQLGTYQDGIVSSQYSGYKKYYTCLSTCEWASSARGSSMVKALQRKIGVSADGILGPGTAKALQNWLNNHGGYGLSVDGYCGPVTGKAIQKALNAGMFK